MNGCAVRGSGTPRPYDHNLRLLCHRSPHRPRAGAQAPRHVHHSPSARTIWRRKSSTTPPTRPSPASPTRSSSRCTTTARSPCRTTAAGCRSTSTRRKASPASRSSSRGCTPARSSPTRTIATPAVCTASASRSSTRSRRSCRSGCAATATSTRCGSRDGKKKQELKIVGQVGKRNTGTTVRFWPDEKFFDSPKFSVPRLKHVMRAKAVLSPEAAHALHQRARSGRQRGVVLRGRAHRLPDLRARRRDRSFRRRRSSATSRDTITKSTGRWSGSPEDGDIVGESYVNLIPTAQGGTHVNGFRTGLTEAIREFCEFRNLLPRGVKLDAGRRVGALQLHPLGAHDATRSSPGRRRTGCRRARRRRSSPA